MPRQTPESDKTIGVSARLHPAELARLKAVGATWPYPPTVSQLIAAAVKAFNDSHEPKRPKR